MKKILLSTLFFICVMFIPQTIFSQAYEFFDIVVTKPNPDDKTILKETKPYNNNTPGVPEFIIKTKNNNFMLAIGGYIKPIIGWDFGNNISDICFTPSEIPVPATKGNKAEFFSYPLRSALDFHVVGFPGSDNQITAYIKIMFNGSKAATMLHDVYLTYRKFWLGRTSSIFEDGASIPTTIDPQGPNGAVSVHSYQVSYRSKNYNGFSFAISAELPTFDKYAGPYRGKDYPDLNGTQYYSNATQPIPDIPAYIQYQGKNKENRIRISGIFRNFCYRDQIKDKTNSVVGWGAELSGNLQPFKPMTLYYQATYGKGIANYIQDLNGLPLSYIPKNNKPGKMEASEMFGWLFGIRYKFSDKICSNIMFSQARIWDSSPYYSDYRYGLYAAGNIFYNINSYLQYGIEYIWGKHSEFSHESATDNRIQTTLKFSF